MVNTRLNKGDWISAGFEALIDSGPQSVKAEILSRRLGTTKGSFYWHFKDVANFHAAMLADWEDRALSCSTELSEAGAAPAIELRKLAQICAGSRNEPAYDSIHTEPAIRAWSRSDPLVAQAVANFDAARLAHLSEALKRCDVGNPELARAIYAAAIGMNELSTRDNAHNENAIGTLVDLVLALR